ncbi:hypothetical protein J2793_006971 [Paraburkholderia caledonica]|uniref:Uncharacterized protein n=1 Tax=Paraburkholderia caledonica TaxID=134536 RepID=A0AB73INE8_9BURK|nr:hypothetical protein [Paraburkholderia caledonica]
MHRSRRVACSLLVFLGAVSASIASAQTQNPKSASPDSGIWAMPERELVNTPVPTVQRRADWTFRPGQATLNYRLRYRETGPGRKTILPARSL